MSETTKHTESPWKVDPLDGGYHIVTGNRGQHVTDFVKPEDANIIASAPDLLASLKGMVRIVEAMRYSTGLGKEQGERLEKAKALIAKAEGR